MPMMIFENVRIASFLSLADDHDNAYDRLMSIGLAPVAGVSNHGAGPISVNLLIRAPRVNTKSFKLVRRSNVLCVNVSFIELMVACSVHTLAMLFRKSVEFCHGDR